jgi:hypothetical protein
MSTVSLRRWDMLTNLDFPLKFEFHLEGCKLGDVPPKSPEIPF